MIFFDSGVSSVFILRMVLQETYEVFDTIKYDNATISSHNDIWEDITGSFVRGADYTTLTEETLEISAYAYTDITSDTIIDFDILQAEGGINRAFAHILQNTSGRVTVRLDDLSSSATTNNWYKVRLIVTDNNLRVINRETEEYNDKTISNTFNRFRFATSNDIESIYFKNFKVYSI